MRRSSVALYPRGHVGLEDGGRYPRGDREARGVSPSAVTQGLRKLTSLAEAVD